MDKRIKTIRKGIKRRKYEKQSKVIQKKKKEEPLHIFPTLEETYDGKVDVAPQLKKTPFSRQRMIPSLVGSVLLFVCSAFLLQTNVTTLQPVAQIVYKGMHEEFPFAKMNEWYVTNFGSPLAIIPSKVTNDQKEKGEVLTEGKVIETFAENGQGMTVQTSNNEVHTLQGGVVIFAGNDKEHGKAVIVQHPDNSKTTYGHLNEIDVHLYEAVEEGERIAKAREEEGVYIQVEKNKTYVDPLDVVPVHDES